jgi:DNA-binding beta-propeller fold protein YncE
MISIPWSVRPAVFAVASLCVSNRPQKPSKLVALCAVLVVLLCGAGSIASAQTAYFSGAQTTLGSGFNLPAGVAVDNSGNVYVADSGLHAVYEIVAVNGSIPTSPTIRTLSDFTDPAGVAVDSSGNVYVTDFSQDNVYEILAVNGSIPASPIVTTLGHTFKGPSGIAVDKSGNVYVAAYYEKSIKEILAVNGVIPAQPTIETLGKNFVGPKGVAMDSSGDVYVADSSESAVYEMLAVNGSIPASPTIKTLGSGFISPDGVAVDKSGNVYASDYTNHAVYEIVAVNGSIPASPKIDTLVSDFGSPEDVTVDGSGNVYVVSAGGSDHSFVLELSPSSWNFGAVSVGTASSTMTLNFTFTGSGTLGSTAVLTQGAAGLDFADAGGDSCMAGTSYTAGETCTVNVTFTPKFAGTRYGATVLRDSNGNAIATGYVQGTGVGPQVSFLPGAQLTLDSFVNPWGVAVDGNGNLYVADNGNLSNLPSGVYKETLSGGSYYKSAIGSGFHTANGVAMDGAGNVYVADQGTLGAGAAYEGPGGVYLETLQGDGSYVQTAIGSGWVLPSYVAVDGSGNVYVTDDQGWDGQGIVSKLTPVNSGYSQATIGKGYNEPFGVAVDGSGNVYFADYANGALYELALSNGSYKQNTVASGFNEPYGVAVDGVGNVYVTVNAQNYWGYTTGPSYVIKEALQSNGTYTQSTVFTGSDFLPDVAVDGSGNLYLADATSNVAYKEDDAYPPSLSFASTNVGSTSSDSPQTVTVQNIGNQELVFTGLSYPTDFPEGAGDANACTSSTSLSPAGQCDLPIEFTPQNAGLLSENVILTDNALNVTGATQSIAVSDTGMSGPPVLTSPIPGSTLTGSSATFQWTAGVGVTKYELYVGTTGVWSRNIYNSGGTMALSASVTGLQAYGETVYVRLWWTINGLWQYTDYTYTESGAPVAAALTTPTPGSTLAGSSATFQWTAGVGVAEYELYVGTTGVGTHDIYNSGGTMALSASVTGLPTYGQTVYVRLRSYINGAWQSADYTYTESGAPVAAALTSPTPGSTLTGSSATFQWTAGGGVTEYELYVGTTGVGSHDIYNSGGTMALSASVTGLPTYGQTVYARLYSWINGAWKSADYTYTAQ